MIGNGNDTRVWLDSWISDNGMRHPFFTNPINNVDLMVKDIIDRYARNWNMEILNDLFFPNDIVAITCHKPVVSRPDFWSWKHNRSGNYTVKSGYWLANKEAKYELINEAIAQPSINGLKEQVWSISTVPKIKTFMWRAMSGAIPVAELLQNRGMKPDLRCQICGVEGESVNHVLFTCSVARQIWALSEIPSPPQGFDSVSLLSNFHYLFQMGKNFLYPAHIRRLFPWVLWRLWKNRNIFFFDGISFNAFDTVVKIREDADFWFTSQSIHDNEELNGRNKVSEKWKPPPTSWFKCNIGTSWLKRKRMAGVSWVVRDQNDSVILHSRRAFNDINNKNEANLQSFIWAAQSMSTHKFQKVIFESEASEIVAAINRPIAWLSFAHQSAECLHCLEKFTNWKVELVKTSTNRGAALIAHSVTSDLRLQSYVASGYPFWLHQLFLDERKSSSV